MSLEEILETDYKFVLISGDYFDCPSCNPDTSFEATTYYDEKALLEAILKGAGSERMDAIWLLDSDDGGMAKYCDINTKAGGHRVLKLEFRLPNYVEPIVIEDKGKGFQVTSPTELILYGPK